MGEARGSVSSLGLDGVDAGRERKVRLLSFSSSPLYPVRFLSISHLILILCFFFPSVTQFPSPTTSPQVSIDASSPRTLDAPFAPLPRRAQQQESPTTVNEFLLPSPPLSSSSSLPSEHGSDGEEESSPSVAKKQKQVRSRVSPPFPRDLRGSDADRRSPSSLLFQDNGSSVEPTTIDAKTKARDLALRAFATSSAPLPSRYPFPFNTFNAFYSPSSPNLRPPSPTLYFYPSAPTLETSPMYRTMNPLHTFNLNLVGCDGVRARGPMGQAGMY